MERCGSMTYASALSTSEQAEPAGPAFFYCFVGFLLLAPLDRAGNRPLPLLLLELAAIGFLFVIIAVHRAPLALPRLLTLAIALLLVYPLVQLIPLPGTLWRMLPGNAEYATVLERFAAPGASDVWRPMSIIPVKTEYGWLALLPALACLLAAMRLSTLHAARLLVVMVAFTGAESLLGLVQYGMGVASIFNPRDSVAHRVATGTFINKDHFAAMLAMMLPVIVSVLLYSLRTEVGSSQRRVVLESSAVARQLLLFGCAVLMLLCLVFTRSRTGIALVLVALVASAIVLKRADVASHGDKRMRVAGIVVTALIALTAILAIVIGVEPVVGGFEPGTLRAGGETRLEFYLATLRAAIDFLPFGSGLSTFAYVFPRFQTGDPGLAIDYAHNDYLQALLELGVVAPLIIGLLLVEYAIRMARLLRDSGANRFTSLQLGAGLGLLPMILHSVFDFPLHMPANAMWFATLAGILFRSSTGEKSANC